MYFIAFHDIIFQLRIEAILTRTIIRAPKLILLTELSTGRYDMVVNQGYRE